MEERRKKKEERREKREAEEKAGCRSLRTFLPEANTCTTGIGLVKLLSVRHERVRSLMLCSFLAGVLSAWHDYVHFRRKQWDRFHSHQGSGQSGRYSSG